MIKINVITSNPNWQDFIKNPTDYVDRKIEKLNIKEKIFSKNIIYCTLLLSGNKEIKYLNKKFRKKNKSTDVLSFPFQTKKEFQKSEEVFKEALSIDKNNASVLNSLGRLYHEKRDSKNAEKYLLNAYNLNNNSYEIINNLAGFYREEGRYKKSIKLYKINKWNCKKFINLYHLFLSLILIIDLLLNQIIQILYFL